MWDVIIWIDNTVDFVPSIWSNNDCTQYKYPVGVAENKVRKMIYACKSLDSYKYKWSKARLVKRKITDLQRAKDLCSKAEETSNIEDEADSDDEDQDGMGRKRKKPLRFYDFEERPKTKRTKVFEDCNQSDDEEEDEISDNRVEFKIPSVPLSTNNCRNIDLVTNSSETQIPTTSRSNTSSYGSASTLTLSNDSRSSFAFCSADENCTELLKSIQFEIKDLSRKLDRLENRILVREAQPRSSDTVDSDQMNAVLNFLPSKSHEELMDLNNIIKNDNTMRQKMINILYLLGGENPRKTIFLIMNKLFGKTLATEYSGQGKKKKKSFADTVLYEVVIEATRKRHSTATDECIKKNISLFLASSKQRLPKEVVNEPDVP